MCVCACVCVCHFGSLLTKSLSSRDFKESPSDKVQEGVIQGRHTKNAACYSSSSARLEKLLDQHALVFLCRGTDAGMEYTSICSSCTAGVLCCMKKTSVQLLCHVQQYHQPDMLKGAMQAATQTTTRGGSCHRRPAIVLAKEHRQLFRNDQRGLRPLSGLGSSIQQILVHMFVVSGTLCSSTRPKPKAPHPPASPRLNYVHRHALLTIQEEGQRPASDLREKHGASPY